MKKNRKMNRKCEISNRRLSDSSTIDFQALRHRSWTNSVQVEGLPMTHTTTPLLVDVQMMFESKNMLPFQFMDLLHINIQWQRLRSDTDWRFVQNRMLLMLRPMPNYVQKDDGLSSDPEMNFLTKYVADDKIIGNNQNLETMRKKKWNTLIRINPLNFLIKYSTRMQTEQQTPWRLQENVRVTNFRSDYCKNCLILQK